MTVAGALLQVRLDSRRLPQKALLRLGNRSCISHVVERVKLAREMNRVVICTSDEEEDEPLVGVAARHHVDAFQGSKNDCLDRFKDCAQTFGLDIVVRVCGDSPLVDPGVIDGTLKLLVEERVDYAFAADLPVGTYVEAFTFAALERAWYAAVERGYSDDLSHFLRRTEINSVASYQPPPHLRRPDLVLALNRPEDLTVLRRLFDQLSPEGEYVPLCEAIRYCDDNPDLTLDNSGYTPVPTRCDTRLDPSRLPRRTAGLAWYEGVHEGGG